MTRYTVLLSQEAKSFHEHVKSKLILPENVATFADGIKASGKTLATLNGSFDLLHAGHLEMIYQASRQADLLFMALNTDRSIQQYKSPLRPIIPLEYRLQMIAALEMVDYITYFDETDPRELLKKIKPNVHVNGAEYGENCIEAEVVRQNGGKVHIVQLVPGLSTSTIIDV